MIIRGLTALTGLFLIAASFGDTRQPARFEYTQPHMGTQFKIILYAQTEELAARASQSAFERIARLDATMSDYRENSELTRLSRQAGRGPVKIGADLFRVLSLSQQFARQTGGAFDVTSGPLIQLWRRARRTRQLPDTGRLTQARKVSGYRKLTLDPLARTARLDRPGMLLDLGGIAKGFAADQAIEVLKRYGIESALVAAGGDIAVSDPPPGADGWVIGVAPLESPALPPSAYLSLRNAAVSTSGDAEQFVEIGGTRYSHIIDPRTGAALTGHSSVTVVAPDGATSDALATSLSVLGPKRGLNLIDSLNRTGDALAAYFAISTGHFESKSWRKFVRAKNRQD